MENEVVVEVHLPSPAANVEIPSEDSEPEVVIENQIESELRNENRSFHVITIDDDDEPEAMDINIEENSSNNEDCEKTELKTNNPENQQCNDSSHSSFIIYKIFNSVVNKGVYKNYSFSSLQL